MEVGVTSGPVEGHVAPKAPYNLVFNNAFGNSSNLKICFVQNSNKKNTFKITLQADMLHHGGNDSVCPVSFCGKKIPKNRSIEDHIRIHLASIFSQVQEANLDDSGFDVEYHCPDLACKYADVKNLGFFQRVKYLKQHYLKIHAPKTLKCSSCHKTFATQSYLTCHQVMCGKSFVCSCAMSYSTLEALQTHARRKSHTFDIVRYKEILSDEKGRVVKKAPDEEEPPATKAEIVEKSSSSSSSLSTASRKYPLLLPKMPKVMDIRKQPVLHIGGGTLLYEAPPSKTTIDFGTQTVPQHNSNSHYHHNHHSTGNSTTGNIGPASRKSCSENSEAPHHRAPKRKQSAETQTARVRVRVSTETQTTNVVKRRRTTNRKQQSVEAQTQCHRESPPKATCEFSPKATSEFPPKATSEFPPNAAPNKKDQESLTVTEMVLSSLKDIPKPSVTPTTIPYFEGDSFFKEMEAHMQTQTEPDLFLGGGENFLCGYDVHVDDSDMSNLLNLMTRETETQTAHSNLQSWSSLMEITKADVDVAMITTATTSSATEEPLSGSLTAPVNTSYLETMDNETQTQFYDFCSIFSKMFD